MHVPTCNVTPHAEMQEAERRPGAGVGPVQAMSGAAMSSVRAVAGGVRLRLQILGPQCIMLYVVHSVGPPTGEFRQHAASGI